MTKEKAIEIAFARHEQGKKSYYDGVLFPEMGEALWDEEEACWAVRVQEEDIPFSCGADCCGYDSYAVVSIDDSFLE